MMSRFLGFLPHPWFPLHIPSTIIIIGHSFDLLTKTKYRQRQDQPFHRPPDKSTSIKTTPPCSSTPLSASSFWWLAFFQPPLEPKSLLISSDSCKMPSKSTKLIKAPAIEVFRCTAPVGEPTYQVELVPKKEVAARQAVLNASTIISCNPESATTADVIAKRVCVVSPPRDASVMLERKASGCARTLEPSKNVPTLRMVPLRTVTQTHRCLVAPMCRYTQPEYPRRARQRQYRQSAASPTIAHFFHKGFDSYGNNNNTKITRAPSNIATIHP